MAEKHARILGELAEFGLDLARKLHGQAMAAETPDETADLARAFHNVSRSVRQTLALEARLARDAHRQDKDDRRDAERLDHEASLAAQRRAEAPIQQRKTRVGAALERIVDAECEDEDEAEALCDEIHDRLSVDSEAPDFLEHAIDDQIARLCEDFGLPAPKRTVASAPRPDPPDPSPPPALGDWADPHPP